ncbi:MAG: type I methionyl aminopeptidase [Parcubacteria group bacterium]|nr:type I methionyl aminopeptidase [Parcubacteria group bacterium]
MIARSENEIKKLREAGGILAVILNDVAKKVVPGISTFELDQYAEEAILKSGSQPSFKGYRPWGVATAYPASLCVSVNDTVVHGLPSQRRLKEGEIISLDLGLEWQGLFVDAALTVSVGIPLPEIKRFLEITKHSLDIGVEKARVGNHIGDIGAAIADYAEKAGYSIIRELVGHGVGEAVHEPPQIPNFGRPGSGPLILEGMVLAIEPMVSLGKFDVILADDGWSWKTKDGSLAAHFEHTILVTKEGPEILTKI